MKSGYPIGVILNAYPDSLGGNLNALLSLLSREDLKNSFSSVYLLPTIFHSDLDRGFSIVDYDLNEDFVNSVDLDKLRAMGIKLKLDIVLNHLSVGSPQFRDLLEKGDESEFKDFFIDWNAFWLDQGELDEQGVIQPKPEFLDRLFTRKPRLPVLHVPFPDGSKRPYWNTFYQEIQKNRELEGEESVRILGQMDVNARSEAVWDFYDQTLSKLKTYGAQIIRLDAFAYLHKEVGSKNFFNTPGTWDYLERLEEMANQKGLQLLPEIHSEYGSGLHREMSSKGYMIYDFFLPALILHAIEFSSSQALLGWAKEIIENNYRTINMLGCHDGIPLLDLKGKQVQDEFRPGLLPDDQIEDLIELVLSRGGMVKSLYEPSGKKISYYQVNATFYSALGEDPLKMLVARALQLFMPGTPQVWYLDLFMGTNDYDAVNKYGSGGHKEINRTNLSTVQAEKSLSDKWVQAQLEMIRFRNTSDAFLGKLEIEDGPDHLIKMPWTNNGVAASLQVDLTNRHFTMSSLEEDGKSSFFLEFPGS